MILILSLCLLAANIALCEQPEWNYPLEPEILQDKPGYITLVNKSHLLDSSYVPEDLTVITMKHVSAINGDYLRKAAEKALTDMFDAALADGYTLYAKSVYRSYSTQKTMYANRLETVGRDDGVVAYPGSSDHQTWLGCDVLNLEWTKKSGMNKEFGKTAEAQWMEAHCAEYGFIIRYMEDKEDITGIIYEPWHLRYVGKEAAAYIMQEHLSLEEFDEIWHGWIEEYEQNGGDFQLLLQERAQPNPEIVLDYGEDGDSEVSVFY